jgi:hypothetical protein
MSTTRTIEPTRITTGGTVEWTRSFTDYPADEWTLQYRFRGPGEGFNIDATQNADVAEKFDVTIDPADTEDVDTAGKYLWEAWMTNIAEPTRIINVTSGFTQIAIGFDADETATIETRTQNEIILASIDAAMSAFATSDVTEYEITTPAGSRRVKRSDKVNLLEMRKHYAVLVSVERTKQRVDNGGSLMRSVSIVVREN